MDKILDNNKILNAINNFKLEGDLISFEPYGNGHINDTYLVVTNKKRYILQRMNTNVFKEPVRLIENIIEVTEFIKKKIELRNGDTSREVLNLISTKDDKKYFVDENQNYFRVYLFIEDSYSLERVSESKEFYESAVAFGNFQKLLSDFDASKLFETIKDFHNTKKRYLDFLEAISTNFDNRSNEVEEEINFIKENIKLTDLIKNLPIRVTHNDTKLNNVLLDKFTHKGLCVIDLDTIMPGLSIFDFGDSIRFGASTALEDEKDLSKVKLDLSLFETYVEGFIKGSEGGLTKEEILVLPLGALIMTYECGMRFLTDYLNGDVYFKVKYKDHNLIRARTQITLLKDMLLKLDKMNEIVARKIN